MKKPRTRKEMIAYLSGHFRYDTMNSWNAATSYAANVKLHRIQFPDKETKNRAWDLLQTEEAFDGVHFLIEEFARDHNWQWQVGFNGRSSGYLVLYQGGREPSGYKSRCSTCGQLNYQTVEESGNNRCGRCGEDARYNMKEEHMRTFTHPGRGVDMHEDLSEWDTYDLRSRVSIVWEFDKLVENCKRAFIEFCKSHTAEEETILVPKTVTVAREINE